MDRALLYAKYTPVNVQRVCLGSPEVPDGRHVRSRPRGVARPGGAVRTSGHEGTDVLR